MASVTQVRRRNGRSVVVIGAGPIGLEAALQAVRAGFDTRVLEAGRVGEHVRRWGHVRLFTPCSMNLGAASRAALLEASPDRELPGPGDCVTGNEYVDHFLEPLAASPALRDRVLTQRRVVSVARHGLLKHEAVGSATRGRSPFAILVEAPDGSEELLEAGFVIDASGVFQTPHCFGPGGMPARGERAVRSQVRYHLPDITGADRDVFAGKRTVLIGAGYSAATSAVALRSLVADDDGTSLVWLTRANRDRPVRAVANDRLPARRALCDAANEISREQHPRVRHIPGALVDRIDRRADAVFRLGVVDGDGTREVIEADEVVANVGYAADGSLYRSLQVHECYATGAPMKLAARLMETGGGDCLDRPPTEGDALVNPEPNFFIVGNKSYGSDPTFLLANGFSQVAQVARLMVDSLQ